MGEASRKRQRLADLHLPPGLGLAQMLTVESETDTTGRLLLEDSAPKQAIARVQREGVAMESIHCPYEDTPSRLGGKMNAPALEALRHDIPAILNGFAWIAEEYLAVKPAPGRDTVQGLLDVSNLATTLPLILFRRAKDPVSPRGGLPPYVAHIFKAGRGIFSVAVDLLNRAESGHQSISVAELMRAAEENSHFRRPQTGRVCAAPTRLIERALDAIVTGAGGDAAKSDLKPLVDFGLLWEFFTLQEIFSDGFNRYRFVMTKLTERLNPTDPERLFGVAVDTAGGGNRTFGEFTDEFLYVANEVQAGLNRLLGRDDVVAPLGFKDLLRIL